MAEYLPKFIPGQAITLTASAQIVGGQLLEVSGAGTVGVAGADSAKVVGVAGVDAASGERLTVYCGGVQRLAAAGEITAGAPVYAAAAGQIQASGNNKIGIALTTAGKQGDLVDVAI